jgi:hypothetical protein
VYVLAGAWGAVMQCLGGGVDNKMLLMDVLRGDTMKVPVIEYQIYMCSACRHIARRPVFRRAKVPITHSLGYTHIDRYALEGARCSPQNLAERGREAAQQTERHQRESSSREDCWLDEGS